MRRGGGDGAHRCRTFNLAGRLTITAPRRRHAGGCFRHAARAVYLNLFGETLVIRTGADQREGARPC